MACIRKGPNIVHPNIPGAIGSRESTVQEGRDKVREAELVIDDAERVIVILKGKGRRDRLVR